MDWGCVMETSLAVILGVGLSAACGFRVFVPLLIAAIAAASGHLTFASDFAWVASWPSLIVLSVATVLEIGAYQVPWLDHALDLIAAPAAVVAGAVLTASFVGDMDPWLRWTTAVIAGGGTAGLVAGGMAVARAGSTALTGGLANPILSAVETSAAVTLAALAVLAPVMALLLALVVASVVVRRARRLRSGPTS